MKRTLAAALIRTGAAIAMAAGLAAGLATGAAEAGDLARPEVIGFSRDGRYVAYEDYGMQDASGFTYSTIYVIDVAANDWVSGTPIRVELDIESLPNPELIVDGVTRARDQAMGQAQAALNQYGIVAGETGTLLVYRPLSDLDAADHLANFSIMGGYSPYGGNSQSLILSEQVVTGHACDRYDLGPVSMMSLQLSMPNQGRTITMQQDSRLPDSRGCVTGYRIHSVYVYAPNTPDQSVCCHDDLAMLVLLSMSSFGFEGPDYRHMGVTTMLHDLL